MSQVEVITSKRARFRCDIIEVHSGDDMVCLADLEIDGLYKKTRIRLAGCDTPDAYQQPADTPAGQVRETVRKLVTGRQCMIVVHTQGRGGWVVTLFVQEGDDPGELTNVNEVLINDGHVFRNRQRPQHGSR